MLRTTALQEQGGEQRTLGGHLLLQLLPPGSAHEDFKHKPLVPSGGQMEQRTRLLWLLPQHAGSSLRGPQELFKPGPDLTYTHPVTLPALNATHPQS